MWHWGLWRSSRLPIGRKHKLLVLWPLRCPEKDLSILEDGISMRLCWHVGHVLQDHLLVGWRWLSRNLPRSRQRFTIFPSHASHAGVDDLSLLA